MKRRNVSLCVCLPSHSSYLCMQRMLGRWNGPITHKKTLVTLHYLQQKQEKHYQLKLDLKTTLENNPNMPCFLCLTPALPFSINSPPNTASSKITQHTPGAATNQLVAMLLSIIHTRASTSLQISGFCAFSQLHKKQRDVPAFLHCSLCGWVPTQGRDIEERQEANAALTFVSVPCS